MMTLGLHAHGEGYRETGVKTGARKGKARLGRCRENLTPLRGVGPPNHVTAFARLSQQIRTRRPSGDFQPSSGTAQERKDERQSLGMRQDVQGPAG